MTELEKVLKVQQEQVASGYTCRDDKSKYAKDIDDNYPEWYNGKKYGFDWCTVYFDWCFIKALGEDRAREVLNRPKKSLGAGVRYSRQYLKDIGRVGNTPQAGCAVYFGELPYPHHIGFVYKVTDDMIYTYEGNCYISDGVSGVKARSYKRSYSDILDYGYPVYNTEPAHKPGWEEKDGKWYFYDSNGNMVKSDWVKYKGQWYYLGEDGAMLTKWQKINGKNYFLYDDGHMASGEWVDGMFLDMSGAQSYRYTAEWKKDSKGRWYQDTSGCYPKSKTVMIDNIPYTFDKDGYLIK